MTNYEFDKLIDAGSDKLLKAWFLSLKNEENCGFTISRHSVVKFPAGKKMDVTYKIEITILNCEKVEAADETATL